MNEFLTTLSSEWAIRALLTSIMVGITCGLIGCFIVLKNMSLIGDALSHSILPGIYVAFILVGYSTLGFFAGSVIAGLITAIAITWIQQNVKTKNDAAIGIVFTAMFSIGVMGISRLNNTQGNHLDLKDFLFGNVLGISNEDIVLSFIVTIYCVLSIVIFYRYFFITTFQSVMAETMGISTKAVHYFLMLMLSFAIVAALRSVGVILVVAMLITPAATAMLLSHELKKILLLSAIIGMLSAVTGLLAAIIFDTVPGPAMVIASTFFYLIATLLSPEKGLIPNYWRSRQETNKIIQEDIIKYLHKSTGVYDENIIAERLSLSLSDIKSNINSLQNDAILTLEGNLTYKGVQKADELVRAHRLWETYQVNDMGMSNDQIHEDAERLEHHLSNADLDEIDHNLGYPDFDPHGSPIPKKKDISTKSLILQKPKSKVVISENQNSKEIESELWELGILPNASILIYKINEKGIELKMNEKSIFIENDLAAEVKVL